MATNEILTLEKEQGRALYDFLALLGNTRDQVASSLRRLRPLVQPKEPGPRSCNCPIARLLRVSGWPGASVCRTRIWPYADKHYHWVMPPFAVEDFITSADEGMYPDLEETIP